MVPGTPEVDTVQIRKIAPAASAFYLSVFLIVCGIVVVAFAADFRMDRNSVPQPTLTKTAPYQSHGRTLYVEPGALRLAHQMNLAASVSIGSGALAALIVTAHAKRKAKRPAP
jgi:hypothetical protein